MEKRPRQVPPGRKSFHRPPQSSRPRQEDQSFNDEPIVRQPQPGAPGLLRKRKMTEYKRTPPPNRWIYLHGFGSSPKAQQGLFFRRKLMSAGLPVTMPDLNVPTFENMTVTSALAQVSNTIAKFDEDETVGIIGSSLGGFLALLAAGRHRCVSRALLLAPALSLFRENFVGFGRVGVKKWERDGFIKVPHPVQGYSRRISSAIVQDARAYDETALRLTIPVMIFHGTRDEIVDSHHSVEYARYRDNVKLHLVDDDHLLLDSVTEIWDALWKEISPR